MSRRRLIVRKFWIILSEKNKTVQIHSQKPVVLGSGNFFWPVIMFHGPRIEVHYISCSAVRITGFCGIFTFIFIFSRNLISNIRRFKDAKQLRIMSILAIFWKISKSSSKIIKIIIIINKCLYFPKIIFYILSK